MSFAFALHYKYHSMKRETGARGVAAGLQACGWEDWHPALRWRAGSCGTGVVVVESHLAPAYSHPPSHRHVPSTECLQLTAPPVFLTGEMGACRLPPLVTFHHMFPPPPFQLSSDPGSPWRSLLLQAVRGRQGASVSQVTLREEPHTFYKH